MPTDPITLRAEIVRRVVEFGEALLDPAGVRDFLDVLMARPSVDVDLLRLCLGLVASAVDALKGSREHEYLSVPREALEDAALSMYHEACAHYASAVNAPLRAEVLV